MELEPFWSWQLGRAPRTPTRQDNWRKSQLDYIAEHDEGVNAMIVAEQRQRRLGRRPWRRMWGRMFGRVSHGDAAPVAIKKAARLVPLRSSVGWTLWWVTTHARRKFSTCLGCVVFNSLYTIVQPASSAVTPIR